MNCSVAGCTSPASRRGWCDKHYRRWQRHGDPTFLVKTPNGQAPATCTVDGCDRRHHAKGLCSAHSARLARHGDPLAGQRHRKHGDLAERAAFYTERTSSGCVVWTGSVAPNGYGVLSIGGKKRVAHKALYEHFVGPVPPGFDLDHMCHNEDPSCVGGDQCMHRRCVNPAHLVPSNRSANMIRAFDRTVPRGA